MSKMPLVSVCIANYNGEHILEECIASIFDSDYENIEIIVHDDCSTDNSKAILDKYSKRITAVYSDVNVGYCISNNKMTDISNGQYILLFNNDAVLDGNALSALVDAIESNEFGILTLVQKDYITREFIDSGRDLDIFLNPIPCDLQATDIQEVATVHGACLFIRKTLWDELGGFPESFESVAEDLYLCLLAQSADYRIGSVNRSHYYHRNGYSFGGGNTSFGLDSTYRRRYLSERNKLLVMHLLYPGFYRMNILLLMSVLVIEGIILSVLKLDRNIFSTIYIKAIGDFIKLRTNKNVKKIAAKQFKLGQKVISGFSCIPYKLNLLLRYGIPRIR